MAEWISVKDRLPRENGKYLCCDEDKRILILRFARCLQCVDEYDFAGKQRSGFYDYDSEYGYFEWGDITHWMSLPEPPKEGANNG